MKNFLTLKSSEKVLEKNDKERALKEKQTSHNGSKLQRKFLR